MFEPSRSKFVREGVPRADNPFVPGTPDNVKAALIKYWDAQNRAVDIYSENVVPAETP